LKDVDSIGDPTAGIRTGGEVTGAAMSLSVRVVRQGGWIIPLALTLSYLTEVPRAWAAPFCLRNAAVPPQCIYYDPDQCQKESIKQGGWCEPNASETRIAHGTGHYCVVVAQAAAICAYLSRESCTAEATRLHGVCYHDEAPGVGTGAPDPYAAFSGPTAPPVPAETTP
jgi:hypothetical protein